MKGSKRVIPMEELTEDFSMSYNDGLGYKEAVSMIEDFIGAKPDGDMLNLSTLPILVANILGVYPASMIKFKKVDKDSGEYFIKVEVHKYETL